MNVLIKRLGINLLGLAGYYRRLHRAHRDIYKIICYHRFTADGRKSTVSKKYLEKSALKRQVDYMQRKFNILELEVCIEDYKKNQQWRNNTLSITVDDGYADFYHFAFPVFKERKISATIFVIYEFVENQTWLWQDKIKYAFRNTEINQLLADETFGNLHFHNYDHLLESQIKVYNQFLALPPNQRIELMEGLMEKLNVQLPEHPPPEYAPLTWQQVREMIQHGMRIGAHTLTHEVLPTLGDDVLQCEINDSKNLIEERIGQRVTTFCYPHGKSDKRAVETVKKSGFLGAVTGIGINYKTADVYRLARLYASNEHISSFINNLYRF